MTNITMDKKYKTRGGQDVRVLCVDKGGTYPVVAILTDIDLRTFSADGQYGSQGTNIFDLIEIKPKVTYVKSMATILEEFPDAVFLANGNLSVNRGAYNRFIDRTNFRLLGKEYTPMYSWFDALFLEERDV